MPLGKGWFHYLYSIIFEKMETSVTLNIHKVSVRLVFFFLSRVCSTHCIILKIVAPCFSSYVPSVYILIKVFVLRESTFLLFLYSIFITRIVIKTVKGCSIVSISKRILETVDNTLYAFGYDLDEINNALRFDFELVSKGF